MINYENIPSPAYVIDEKALLSNLETIDRVRREGEVEIIVALKANASWAIFPLLAAHSDGATASSLSEALLVKEEFKALAHTYAPIYVESEIDAILDSSSHITFNSLAQYQKYGERARQRGISCGLRVNPRYSPVETDLYNPCVAGSRLGIPPEELESLPDGIEGLHFHVLCESRSEHLERALEAFERYYGKFIHQLKWVNMGGGHLMTHQDYNCDHLIEVVKAFKSRHPHLRLILEPGSAFTWRSGTLFSTIEDIVNNDGIKTAMLNVSFACHMPDCLEMPYKPTIIGAKDTPSGEKGWRMGGNSCLAGDYIGDWSFEQEPKVGDRVIFEDMIHYTMVKTTMFNGVSHPSLVIARCDGSVDIIREYGYQDYKNRMG
ncbi:MAG: carboxynorspermidine decarboxylase [Rikenellaceae bacterium]